MGRRVGAVDMVGETVGVNVAYPSHALVAPAKICPSNSHPRFDSKSYASLT